MKAPAAAAAETSRILLTGASGYVGGRLLTALENQHYRVRCLVRRPAALQHKASPSTEIVGGDVLDRPSLDSALQGVDVAYYLVHSMGSTGSFEDADRQAALNFGQAAKAAGVTRLIYLGGLGSAEELLSPHLRSRQEVGQILRQSGVPVLEFRASIVIGSGSLSFEMIRSLVERWSGTPPLSRPSPYVRLALKRLFAAPWPVRNGNSRQRAGPTRCLRPESHNRGVV